MFGQVQDKIDQSLPLLPIESKVELIEVVVHQLHYYMELFGTVLGKHPKS
ncbi:MAG: hypothetical protein CM15mP127_05780 [Gammaproteobacteria bacterium]|nr:MAG: hypothetical protein CM15mP127_05780 [Gammaproteobacteria bacterium]